MGNHGDSKALWSIRLQILESAVSLGCMGWTHSSQAAREASSHFLSFPYVFPRREKALLEKFNMKLCCVYPLDE